MGSNNAENPGGGWLVWWDVSYLLSGADSYKHRRRFVRTSRSMAKPISRPLHGLLTDYPYVLIVGSAPFWLGLDRHSTPAILCFVLAGLILLTSLVTRAEWGLVRVLPYKLHLLGDVLVGLLAVAAPFLFHFADLTATRNAFIIFGLFGIGAGTLSQSNEMPAPVR